MCICLIARFHATAVYVVQEWVLLVLPMQQHSSPLALYHCFLLISCSEVSIHCVMICRERVGSSQNSPSSSRSLPPLAPAHEGASDTGPPQSYPHPQQQQAPGAQPMHSFQAGIKLEPGTSFSPGVSRAAQSAAVANLGAAPPPADSPGSLSRTSSQHVVGASNSMSQLWGNPPAWLCQPLSTPMPFSPRRIYQLDGTPVTPPTGRGGFSGQPPAMPPALMQQHSLSMSRTLSEADISNQSAMSALTGSSVHHMTLPPAASTSRPNFQTQSPMAGPPAQWSPASPRPHPRKLRTSMSYQDLSGHPLKQASPQSFPSPTPPTLTTLQLQNQTQQQPQHAQQLPQQQQQQRQQGNMMVRVGSETHLIPEAQGGGFFRRAPSAPFMNLDQRSSSRSQYESLESRLQGEGPPSMAPFGNWAPDSLQVLGIKQQEASDMQVCLRSKFDHHACPQCLIRHACLQCSVVLLRWKFVVHDILPYWSFV